MTTRTIPDSHIDLVEQPNTAVFTTLNTDGQPQSTAVWFNLKNSTVRVSVATRRQKYKNLVHEPRATLFVMDPTNPFRTLEIRATVELLPDPSKADVASVAQRYNTALEGFVRDDEEFATAILHPSRVVAIG